MPSSAEDEAGPSSSGGEKPHHLGHRQRLRTRLLEGGATGIPDYELLEILLWAANPRGDTKPLAKRLIDEYGGFAALLSADRNRLLATAGVGESAAAIILAAREAALRLIKFEVKQRPVLSSWQKLVEYCTAQMAHEAIEQFRLLFLDRKNILIADEAQQKGTVDHTPVYTREVVKRALELGASAIIMVQNQRNHPECSFIKDLRAA